MNLLHTIGLMTRAEHKRLTDELDNDAFASWNKAITDRDDMRMQRDDWQAKHASVCTKLNEMTAKFKKAVADLQKQAGEIAELKGECVELRRSLRQRTNDLDHIEGQEELSERLIAELRDEIESLRPDALAMRRKRQMDRDRRKGNG